MVCLWYFDCVAEHCVRLITRQHFDFAFVFDLGVVHLLVVTADLFGDRVRERFETSGVVLEAVRARTILHDDFTADCLIVLGADVVLVIAVLDFDCAVRGWRLSRRNSRRRQTGGR